MDREEEFTFTVTVGQDVRGWIESLGTEQFSRMLTFAYFDHVEELVERKMARQKAPKTTTAAQPKEGSAGQSESGKGRNSKGLGDGPVDTS